MSASNSRAAAAAVTVHGCSSRSCDRPVAGPSPVTGLGLCQIHLGRDVKRLAEQKAGLIERLHALSQATDRRQLRLEQQLLTAEILELQGMFDALLEKVQQWRDRTVSRVQAALDSVARQLRDAAEAEECEKELSIVSDAGDMRKLMELTVTAESWLDDAFDRSVEFDRVRSQLRDRQKRRCSGDVGLGGDGEDGSDESSGDEDSEQASVTDCAIVSPEGDSQPSCVSNLRSVGDVSAGVQQLQFVIDRHMTDVMQQCWLDDAEAGATVAPPLCRSVATIDDLGSGPCHVTGCTNTSGFVGDSSGCVARADSSTENCAPLPQPCIFVSFNKGCADHLLVTSLDGAVRLKCHCSSLNWRDWISGIHCDCNRQLIFVAQFLSVTAMDLSGTVTRVINSSSLGQPLNRITAVTGNSDKVFVLDRGSQKVLAIGKESGQVESVISVSAFDFGGLDELALHGSKILLVDCKVGRVHRVCGISGQLISSYPVRDNSLDLFILPGQAAVDSRGLVYVSENRGLSVRVLTSCGTVLQVLRVPIAQAKSAQGWRFSLTVLEDGLRSYCQLVVANEMDNQLAVYTLS